MVAYEVQLWLDCEGSLFEGAKPPKSIPVRV